MKSILRTMLLTAGILSLAQPVIAADPQHQGHAMDEGRTNGQVIAPDRSDNHEQGGAPARTIGGWSYLDRDNPPALTANRGEMVPVGGWSYLDRDNPPALTANRGEMVPVDGETHAFRFAGELAPSAVCASLDPRRIMVDRATQAACRSNAGVSPFAVSDRAGEQGQGGNHDQHTQH